MKEPLTPRQTQILKFVTDYVRQNGFAPSVRDVMRAFHFKSPKGAADHLKALERKGHLVRTPDRARALRVPQGIPIVGRIAAGRPILAEENFQGALELPPGLFAKGDVFALTVKGDSMEGDHIVEGDSVIVRKQETVANGEIAAVMLDNEATLKRVFFHRNSIELRPSNAKYKSVFLEQDVVILGKMVGLIRR